MNTDLWSKNNCFYFRHYSF